MSLRIYILWLSRGKVFNDSVVLEQIPYWENAIVLGAGVQPNGSPSRILQDRLITAAELYHQGKVKRLILTGANYGPKQNEAKAMAEALQELQVPFEALILDDYAFNTRENCERAQAVLHIQKAFIVTQSFHLPRALYLCENYGIESLGIAADRSHYSLKTHLYLNLREILATAKAWWQVNFSKETSAKK